MAIRLHRDSTHVQDINLLDVQRIYDTRPAQRQAEHVRLIYSVGERASETRASIPWESMAQLRTEMARSGKTAEDDELLQSVLVPWALEQLELTLQSGPPSEDGFTLDFGDSPRPPAVRETLLRYGLLAEN